MRFEIYQDDELATQSNPVTGALQALEIVLDGVLGLEELQGK